MNVAILNRHPEERIGGSELQCDILARELSRLGHRVLYLAAEGELDSYGSPYAVEPLPGKELGGLEDRLESFRPDILFWRYNKNRFLKSAELAARLQIPVVFSVSHRNDVTRLRTDLLKPGANVRETFLNWQEFMRSAREHGGFRQVAGIVNQCREFMGRFARIPEIYFPNSFSDDFIPFEWPRPYCIWVGNIKRRKNPGALIRLAERLRDLPVDLLMVGQIQDETWEWLRDPGRLPPNLHYMGPRPIPETAGMIRSSLLLVQSSLPEGFPNTFIQAWGHGRPVVSLQYDPDGLIESEGLGALSGSEKQFASDVRRFLTEEELRFSTGERARRFAARRFDARRNARTLESFLRQIHSTAGKDKPAPAPLTDRSPDPSALAHYLHFGYLIRETERYPIPVDAVQQESVQGDYEELIEKLHNAFRHAIRNTPGQGRLRLVPLSGGVDSRLILAELLRQTDPAQIRAVSFGVPGSLDFDLATEVAEKCGVEHHRIDLREADYSAATLIETASSQPAPSRLLESYANRLLTDRYGNEALLYSGHFGDLIGGSIDPELTAISTFDEALAAFVRRERLDKSGRLPVLKPEELSLRPDSHHFLTPYEQLNFRVRQTNLVEMTIFPPGVEFAAPFTSAEFAGTFYGIGERIRRSRPIFYDMVRSRYERDFRIGVKTCFGASLFAGPAVTARHRKWAYGKRILARRYPALGVSDPLLNYTDPWWLLAGNRATAQLAEIQLRDLRRRDVTGGIDPCRILEEYRGGGHALADAVLLLLDLELYLKAGHLRTPPDDYRVLGGAS